jgi:trans-L-3-hydroxyproline dehydratase
MTVFIDDSAWKPQTGLVVKTVDMHTGGEPLRIVTDGLPPIDGSTVLEKRRFFKENYDFLRTGLMWEPRGHADMYGAIVTPSNNADFDVFFLHNEGYSTMCGHAIIALTTLVLEAGLLRRAAKGDENGTSVTFNVPAGRIQARAKISAGRVCDVTFRNVPSFVFLKDGAIEVPGIGRVQFDIAFGGAFYALVDAHSLGLSLTPESFIALIEAGRRIKHAIAQAFDVSHPYEKDLSFLYGVIFTGPPLETHHHSRNVCIFAAGEVDRSATGSGVSARAALHHARGDLELNRTIVIESILGSTMSVTVTEAVKFGTYDAVVPEVGGSAFVTGRHEFFFDPADPLRRGFIFR